VQVDPQSGNIFAQTSSGSGPPSVIQAPGLQVQTSIAGWRQDY
jgi:hypothetical protein